MFKMEGFHNREDDKFFIQLVWFGGTGDFGVSNAL